MTQYPLAQLNNETRLLVSWQMDLPIGPVQVYELNRAGLHPITHNTGNPYLHGYPALLDHRIFYTTQKGDSGHLFVVDRERRVVQEIAANGRVKHELSLSPDGRHLAYWEHPAPFPTGGELIIHDWQNDERVAVQPGHRILDWHWSVDSDSLVGVSWGGRQTPHLYHYALDGTAIESQPLSQFDGKQGLTLSPDWQHMAYLEDDYRLVIADLNAHHAQHIGFLNDRESPPVWSPDGRWLAWAGSLDRTHMDERFDLCVAKWDTHERWTLMALNEDDESHAINPGLPVWSANSRRLAIDSFVSTSGNSPIEGMALFIIDIETRTVRRVTEPAGIIFRVAWI